MRHGATNYQKYRKVQPTLSPFKHPSAYVYHFCICKDERLDMVVVTSYRESCLHPK